MKRYRMLRVAAGRVLALSLAASAQAGASVYRLGPVDAAVLVNPSPAASARFGSVMASGDFNGDGVDDLAMVMDGFSEVRVFFGQAWTVGDLLPASRFTESLITFPKPLFNARLAGGDFDDDGDDELVLGDPGYDGSAIGAGRALVLRYTGSTWVAQESIEQGVDGYSGGGEAGDGFGSSLAVGDFDADGYEDLAIGVESEMVGSTNEAGAVMIAYGSSSGITAARDHHITRDNDGLTVSPTTLERYGSELASGDFNDDGYADLAIAAPRARCPDAADAGGAVIMLLGSASGIVNTGTRQFRPGVLGVQGSCVDNMVFGRTLVAGRFDSGSAADLAIATGQDAVHVLYGSAGLGLQTDGDQRITPASLPGSVVGDTRFGISLAAGRFNNDPFSFTPGKHSLAIGASFDTVDGLVKAGSVHVVPGSSSGLLPAQAQRFTRHAARAMGPPVTVDLLGMALGSGDFNGDSRLDLAIGVPYYDLPGFADRGAVAVLFSSEIIFRDGWQ